MAIFEETGALSSTRLAILFTHAALLLPKSLRYPIPSAKTLLYFIIEAGSPQSIYLTEEDRAYLREKPRALQSACAAYNKKAARDALSGIEPKAWPSPAKERLDAIAEQLLHSKFKAIVSIVGEMVEEAYPLTIPE